MGTTLYIVRHAWAVELTNMPGARDADRPLTEEGRTRFTRVAKKLSKRGCTPAHIATSPYQRCRETAAILQRVFPVRPAVVVRDELAPGSNLEGLLRWTSQFEADPIAWVGHAPDVDQLTAALIGDRHAQLDFSKGAVAAISFAGRAGVGWGVLEWFITPKIIGC